ncbi:hypothetical protein VTN49DRAFT_5586 [Thermomyces lanuginosus]|uniref:uncharacterized protein n=1 Tax=Thermomyces lanuginosus TaxID=5541 RepID=UPI0037447031
MALRLSRVTRLALVIAITMSFFFVEISVGFYTHSLALVADAFHYLNDLIAFVIALIALRISRSDSPSPKNLSFGWQRAEVLGSFFNGVFLLALGIGICLQSIEKFIFLDHVENPKLVLIVACCGLALNFVKHHHHAEDPEKNTSQSTLCIPNAVDETASAEATLIAHLDHRHHHSLIVKRPQHDLGMLGVFLHVLGDALNNIGVIISALVIWLAKHEGRYYADPAVSVAIALMIFVSALPLVRNAGYVLLESVPPHIDVDDVKSDLEMIPGVSAVHDLHIWRLSQHKSLASVHVVHVPPEDSSVVDLAKVTKTINECFQAYGIHAATIQPEIIRPNNRQADAGREV